VWWSTRGEQRFGRRENIDSNKRWRARLTGKEKVRGEKAEESKKTYNETVGRDNTVRRADSTAEQAAELMESKKINQVKYKEWRSGGGLEGPQ